MNALRSIDWIHIGYAICIILFGYIISHRLGRVAGKLVAKRFSQHEGMLAKRVLFYGLFIMFFISALQQLGFNLGVLLGAAGLITVALSFASQTAASNLISGIFLLFEHPFKVGNIIEVKGISGTVNSIDLLSTKIRTFDNKLVRIPNEVMIKSEITNLSYFPTRRVELVIGVSYDCNIARVQALLLDIARSCDVILTDPEPVAIINNFQDSAVELKLMAWTTIDNFGAATNQLKETIKARFDEQQISMPFPQLTIHKG